MGDNLLCTLVLQHDLTTIRFFLLLLLSVGGENKHIFQHWKMMMNPLW